MKKRITMTESLCMRDTKKFLGNIMKVPHFIGNYPGMRVEKRKFQTNLVNSRENLNIGSKRCSHVKIKYFEAITEIW